eukprot:jgi/Mesvir1/29364/Mv02544-RA.1
MAARAALEHERYAASYNKGAVRLPDPTDVEVDVDKWFEQPLGPIRPYIRTKRIDAQSKSVVFRTRDIGVYVTESTCFKGIQYAEIEDTGIKGAVVHDLPRTCGGVHVTLELVKPFVLAIPCHPDSVEKRVAMCNHLLKLLGTDAFVHKSEVKVSKNHNVRHFAKGADLLKREAERRKVQLYFTLAWCEDVLSNYSRALKRFDDADGTAKREFYDLAKKMDRAEVLYPESKRLMEKLSQTPLPLKSTPAWVHDADRVKASELPEMDKHTQNQILRTDLAFRDEKCARLEKEIDKLRTSMEEIRLLRKSDAPCAPSAPKPMPPPPLVQAPPPSVADYTRLAPLDGMDPFQQAVRCLVDGMRHQLPQGVYMLVHAIRDMVEGETVPVYRDRVMHTLHSMSLSSPPVARALQMLYSSSWSA